MHIVSGSERAFTFSVYVTQYIIFVTIFLQMECRFVVLEQMWLPEPIKVLEQKCSPDIHFTCSEGIVRTENDILEEELDVSKLVV